MPKIIDTHTHVNFNSFKDDSREVIERALKNSVWLVNVGSQASTSRRAVEMAQNYQEGVYAAVGLHPSHLENTEINLLKEGEDINYETKKEDFDENFYLKLAENKKVVAIGECGLDYYQNQKSEIKNQNDNEKFKIKELQKEVFIRHIELAKKIKKPLIIHCRDAHDDLIKILNSNPFHLPTGGGGQILNSPAGVMHFFTGSYEQAKQYIDLGFYISFSGVITFVSEYEELVRKLPLDKILIETDAPYVAPVPYRGKKNEPSYVIEIAKKMAEIKGVSFEDICRQTTENAKVVFGLKI